MADAINSNDYYKNMQLQAAAQRTASTKEASLGMKDFLTLLVAQLQNQDMMNPMNDTEFISQMAQYSSLQTLNSLSELTTTSYAVSLLGKEVTAAALDSNGQLVQAEGTVTGITLFEGEPVIYIGEKSFKLQSIMTVGTLSKAAETETDSGKTGSDVSDETEIETEQEESTGGA